MRHTIFGSGADLAGYAQFCWLISHHGLFAPSTILSSASPDFYVSPLADHLSLILVPIALIYRFLPSPVTLIIIQVLCAWLYIVGMIRIIQRRFTTPVVCALLSAALSLYPPLHFQIRNDFHTDVFVMLSIPWLWVGITERRHWLFLASLSLALFAKETGGLVMVAIGTALLFTRQHRKFGLWICVASAIWLLISQLIMLPYIRGHKPQPAIIWYYGYLGNDLAEIALNLLAHPSKPLKHLLSKEALLTTIQMLLPLLFLPMLHLPSFAPASVPFLQSFISEWEPTRNFIYQGMMPTAALLSIGCIEAIGLIGSLAGKLLSAGNSGGARKISEFLSAYSLILFTIASWQLIFPRQLYLQRDFQLEIKPRVNAIKRALALIPKDAPVIASTHLLPHLANRRYAWLFEWHNPLRDRKLKLTSNWRWRSERLHKDVYIAIELEPLDIWKPITPSQLEQIKRWKQIEVLLENKQIVLLKYRQR